MKRLLVLAVSAACLLTTASSAAAQTAHTRIVSGSDVAIEDHPYQVVLRRDGSFICGGSILDATTVVTAAHCVTAQNDFIQVTHTVYSAARFSIGYGSASRDATTRVQVSSIAVPSAYQAPAGSADESYDLAILRLASPISLSAQAQPITLASAAQSKSTGTAFVTGWGDTTDGGSDSQTLQGVELALQPDSACDGYGNQYQAERSVCAGGGSGLGDRPDTCQGDSGGPLAVQSAGAWQLLGITSFGDGCGKQNTPGVYTWVQGSNIASFIEAHGGIDASTPPVTPPPAPVPTAPAPIRDSTRPTLRYSKFSCTKKRRCTVRVRAADNLGLVAKFSAKVSRKVKRCTRRHGKKRCRTVTTTKTLRTKRVTGGFDATGTLARASYTFTAVGTDASGNRSKTLRRTVRVRH